MNKYKKISFKNLYFSSISILGLLILTLLVLYTPSSKNFYYFQEQTISSIFILICILGMIAALQPSRCSALSNFKKPANINPEDDGYQSLRSHHPDCDNFKPHTYTLMGKKYCAGCTGLFTGALIAVIGTGIYSFYIVSFGTGGELIFFVGFVSVLVALLQNFFWKINLNIGKFFFNLMLVLGSFLLLVSINEMNEGLFVHLYFLVLVTIFIMARISSSEKNHTIICDECLVGSSCIYR